MSMWDSKVQLHSKKDLKKISITNPVKSYYSNLE